MENVAHPPAEPQPDAITRALHVLRDLGITYAVVERCPVGECPPCEAGGIDLAA